MTAGEAQVVMARLRECPNCGQHTGRTEDWACQWCGYPVLSESYKKIEGTYGRTKPAGAPDGGSDAGPAASPGDHEEPVTDVESDTLPVETLPEMASEPEPDVADAEQEEPEDAGEDAADASSGDDEEPITQPVADEPEVAPRAEVTAGGLCTAFLDCGMEAHEEFRDRSFRLTGIADAVIIKDIVGRYQLALRDSEPHPLGNVFCTFEKKDVPLLARVEVGRQVTVDGTYFGFTSNIVLTDCSMVS